MRLIVVEFGASGLVAHAGPDGSDHTVVVAQVRGESPSELCSRAVRRLRRSTRCFERIEKAILIIAARFDAEATAARLALLRALSRYAVHAVVAPDWGLDTGTDPDGDVQSGVISIGGGRGPTVAATTRSSVLRFQVA